MNSLKKLIKKFIKKVNENKAFSLVVIGLIVLAIVALATIRIWGKWVLLLICVVGYIIYEARSNTPVQVQITCEYVFEQYRSALFECFNEAGELFDCKGIPDESLLEYDDKSFGNRIIITTLSKYIVNDANEFDKNEFIYCANSLFKKHNIPFSITDVIVGKIHTKVMLSFLGVQ